jgi:hypothetical protein
MLYVHPTDEEMYYDTPTSQSPSSNVSIIQRACANGHHLTLVSIFSRLSFLPPLRINDIIQRAYVGK